MERDGDCWILTDGAAGNTRQCEALVHYLGGAARVIEVRLRQPWEALAPHLRLGARAAVAGALAEALRGGKPELLVSAGRRAALGALVARKALGGAVPAVQILDPRIDPGHFDLVICPRHDGLTGANVLTTRGALHAVDAARLAQWRADWASRLGSLPGPRAALLVGASNRAVQLSEPLLDRLAGAAERCAGENGTVLLTTSRRTPAPLGAWLRRRLGDRAVHAEDFPTNPYPGFLAWADHLLVSPDSVNMLSEALGTGRPVYSEIPELRSRRFRRFLLGLRDEGRLLGLSAAPARLAPEPLRETAAVAAEVRRRIDAAAAQAGRGATA